MTDAGLRRATACLGVLGAAIAAYLVWVHYRGLDPVCVGGGGGCERVQSSDYAELGGVPVAVVGLAGYVAIVAAMAVRGEAGRLLGAFLALVGFGFSAYLTYLEIFVIEAICQWCVASAVVMTALLGVALARVLAAP